jgi:hypothetical protein
LFFLLRFDLIIAVEERKGNEGKEEENQRKRKRKRKRRERKRIRGKKRVA